MIAYNDLLLTAKRVLESEANAITAASKTLDQSFYDAVKRLSEVKGRIVLTGIGKSAIICQKIVATLNSTGSPSLFMHAADAIHGDLGMIQNDDAVICISQSGNTPEIKLLVPIIKHAGNPLIAITGNIKSDLAKKADYVLLSYVDKEACPLNLAPTTSSTLQLALGDALAVCLLEWKGFTERDFARFHPGGALGKRLYMKVDDFLHHSIPPIVNANASIQEVILEITSKRLGCTAVVENEELVGIITDGDLRRMIETGKNPLRVKAKDIMSHNPKTLPLGTMAVYALETVTTNNITQVLVTDGKKIKGIIHIHDLIREGIV